MIKGVVKVLRESGKDISKHHNPIDPDDMNLLNKYLLGGMETGSPRALQQKVFLDLMLHFGRRGREGLIHFTRDSFEELKSSEGKRYLTMSHNEEDKNHHGAEPEKKMMMFEQEGELLCPLQSFCLYFQHLNPQCSAFWQTPKASANIKPNSKNEAWYKNCPMGINTLGGMMKDLSKEADLSKVYTNHCLRATVASALYTAGVEREDIKLVTGHLNAKSLDPYISTATDKKRDQLSKTLFEYGKENIESVAIDQANPSDSAMVPVVPPAVVPDPSVNIVADTPWKPVIDIPYLLQQSSHSDSRNAATILGGASFSGATTINFIFK